ncbi:hypothetical protein BDB01DRAFT_769436 [Pilobolus umbonatus]|nr:hypothetical protein BDB01DRAFT_769436 [Pilobolus umbonatus]
MVNHFNLLQTGVIIDQLPIWRTFPFSPHFFPMVSREYILIKRLRDKGKPVDVRLLRTAIIQEAKHEGAFARAEELFEDMVEILNRQKSGNIPYTASDVEAFHYSMATMTRYAPTAQKSMDYGYYLLKECEPPLRTKNLHLMVLTNLVYKFGENVRDNENMKIALSLIKEAFSLKIFQEDPSTFTSLSKGCPLIVFENVSKKVLLHFGLKLSNDKSSLVPIR